MGSGPRCCWGKRPVGPSSVPPRKRPQKEKGPVQSQKKTRRTVEGTGKGKEPAQSTPPRARAEAVLTTDNYLGVSPQSVRHLTEMMHCPQVTRDFYASAEPTPEKLDFLPASARVAMSFPAKAWRRSDNATALKMSPHENMMTSYALLGQSLNHMVISAEQFEKRLESSETKTIKLLELNKQYRNKLDSYEARVRQADMLEEQVQRLESEKLKLEEEKTEAEKILAEFQKKNDELMASAEAFEKEKEDSKIAAVSEYQQSDENEYLMYRSFALGCVKMISVINRYVAEGKEVDMSKLQDYVRRFCANKNVLDVPGYEIHHGSPSKVTEIGKEGEDDEEVDVIRVDDEEEEKEKSGSKN